MKTAAITSSASGDNTVVAAVTAKRIKVVGGVLSFSGSVNARWKSGSSTDLSGLYYGATGTVVPLAALPALPGGVPGHVTTSTGEALVLNLSGAVAVGGHVVYEEVD